MGRPRKRQFIESAAEDTLASQEADPLILGSVPFVGGEFDPYNDGIFAEPYFTSGQSNLALPAETTMPGRGSAEDGRIVWRFGDQDIMGGGPINFGDIDFGSVNNTTPPLDPAPQLATGSNTSVASETSPRESGGPPCSCLASMYLSLASMQEFPSDIAKALKTVRGACATAASSIWCRQCGTVMLETPSPPIEAFQNVMLLGTILPTIANGYQRLLQMVDDETNTADSMGQMKTFNFLDYGGLCGQQTTVAKTLGSACAQREGLFKEVEMPPQQWRTTVRALLRVDIYGHEQPGFRHKGLKDLVAEMETRQRTRHDMLDARLAAFGGDSVAVGTFGTLKTSLSSGPGGHGYMKCGGQQTHGCLQILQMARVAIDNLIIA
jgi:hypothetical protein